MGCEISSLWDFQNLIGQVALALAKMKIDLQSAGTPGIWSKVFGGYLKLSLAVTAEHLLCCYRDHRQINLECFVWPFTKQSSWACFDGSFLPWKVGEKLVSAACMNIGKLSWIRPRGETGFMCHKSVEQLLKDAELSWGLWMCSCRAPPQLGRGVWCENLSSPLLRLWEVLTIITHGWDHFDLQFYLFETRAFIYVPLYRIRCNHFSIFVLIATGFHGTKLR